MNAGRCWSCSCVRPMKGPEAVAAAEYLCSQLSEKLGYGQLESKLVHTKHFKTLGLSNRRAFHPKVFSHQPGEGPSGRYSSIHVASQENSVLRIPYRFIEFCQVINKPMCGET